MIIYFKKETKTDEYFDMVVLEDHLSSDVWYRIMEYSPFVETAHNTWESDGVSWLVTTESDDYADYEFILDTSRATLTPKIVSFIREYRLKKLLDE